MIPYHLHGIVNNVSYSAAETIRAALALGADSGIHVMTDMKIDQDL
jgi:hypothetical protein